MYVGLQHWMELLFQVINCKGSLIRLTWRTLTRRLNGTWPHRIRVNSDSHHTATFVLLSTFFVTLLSTLLALHSCPRYLHYTLAHATYTTLLPTLLALTLLSTLLALHSCPRYLHYTLAHATCTTLLPTLLALTLLSTLLALHSSHQTRSSIPFYVFETFSLEAGLELFN
jgi:hypothetical protein